MLKSIPFADFAQALFDSPQIARKAAIILKAILDAQSPRLSEIAQKMPGKPDANYKQLQRFLQQTDPQATLLRLFQTDAPFVIGDSAAPSQTYFLRGNPDGRGNPRLLALDLGNALSGTGTPVSFCDLFVPDDCRRGQFAELEPSQGGRRDP